MGEIQKLGENIGQLIHESEFKTQHCFLAEIKKIFETKAISPRTLGRCVSGVEYIRETTLFQIAFVLRKSPSEIREGTADEDVEHPKLFKYNEKAYLERLNDKLPFLPTKTVLKVGGHTDKNMQDPQDGTKYLKWIYIIKGKVELCIEGKLEVVKHELESEGHFAFDSTQKHYVKNIFSKASSFIFISYPNKQ